jgi:hypothetical protein
MNPKYSLKVIKQGQTQKVYVVSPGAGMQGLGVNVPVSEATRLQLTDIVTLTAPEQLQMKRVGRDLQIALPELCGNHQLRVRFECMIES